MKHVTSCINNIWWNSKYLKIKIPSSFYQLLKWEKFGKQYLIGKKQNESWEKPDKDEKLPLRSFWKSAIL